VEVRDFFIGIVPITQALWAHIKGADHKPAGPETGARNGGARNGDGPETGARNGDGGPKRGRA
jgi:hypothetical protein